MAPGYSSCYGPFAITQIRLNDVTPTYANGIGYVQPKKVETKKERIKRIAIEKMHASWKKYNQKTPTTIEIKQICKPIHRIGHMGGRRK